MSSLRKFFHFLKLEGIASNDPFELDAKRSTLEPDPYHLRDFKNHLYVYNAANLTIKNYIIDVKQFLNWTEQVTGADKAWHVKDKNIFDKIDALLIEEYKNRLSDSGICATSINRKLSSLRRYLKWAESDGLIKNASSNKYQVASIPNKGSVSGSKYQVLSIEKPIEQQPVTNEAIDTGKEFNSSQMPNAKYSKFPPIRLFQKISKGINLLLDTSLISPLTKTIEKGQYIAWKLRGRPIFTSTGLNRIIHRTTLPGNIKKEIYAPLAISTKYFPFHKKAWFHLRHSRPNWYRRYHQYPVVHYFHFAILVVFMSALGFTSYRAFFEAPKKDLALAAPVAPPRILSFQGRLTDNNDNPIAATKAIRFAIYNDLTASGAALLWQEIDTVSPDTDGIFSILLGNQTSIDQSLFAQNASLYLGVTITQDSELTPRQQLATVAYATNAEVLQGMPPTTDAGQTTNTNTILALNSSGTLAIGGVATTTFQATSAQFKITGQPLLLTTNGGSNGNVAIVPDGTGIIDLQKPLQNTSNSNNISTAVGSVEVDDLFSILATSSGQSAFTINQTGSGPIISASASGIAKFTISNAGNAYIAGNLGIANANPVAALDISGGLTMTGYATVSSSLSIGYSTILGGVGNGVFSGNVGVGTTNPSQKLEVASGNFKITSGNIILNNNWLSGDGGNEGVFVKSDGNVGIGTTDPGSKLQIAGNVTPEATGTRDLGATDLYWNNLYVNNIIGAATGIQGFWQRNSQAISPTNITDDFLLGATATSSAKFGFLNMANGTPTATISSNLSLQVPTGATPVSTLNILNGGSLAFGTSAGGDTGITAAYVPNAKLPPFRI